MIEALMRPWPWFVAGPLIGVIAAGLLLVGGKLLGVSGSYRTICAIAAPGTIEFFRFDWRRLGAWNVAFVVGITIGGLLAATLLAGAEPAAISAAARADLVALGITDFRGLVPAQLFSWESALTLKGMLLLGGGGFLLGFGSAYGGGCTSGHGIMGLADLQLPSLVAVTGFFVGGLLSTHLLLPHLL